MRFKAIVLFLTLVLWSCLNVNALDPSITLSSITTSGDQNVPLSGHSALFEKLDYDVTWTYTGYSDADATNKKAVFALSTDPNIMGHAIASEQLDIKKLKINLSLPAGNTKKLPAQFWLQLYVVPTDNPSIQEASDSKAFWVYGYAYWARYDGFAALVPEFKYINARTAQPGATVSFTMGWSDGTNMDPAVPYGFQLLDDGLVVNVELSAVANPYAWSMSFKAPTGIDTYQISIEWPLGSGNKIVRDFKVLDDPPRISLWVYADRSGMFPSSSGAWSWGSDDPLYQDHNVSLSVNADVPDYNLFPDALEGVLELFLYDDMSTPVMRNDGEVLTLSNSFSGHYYHTYKLTIPTTITPGFYQIKYTLTNPAKGDITSDPFKIHPPFRFIPSLPSDLGSTLAVGQKVTLTWIYEGEPATGRIGKMVDVERASVEFGIGGYDVPGWRWDTHTTCKLTSKQCTFTIPDVAYPDSAIEFYAWVNNQPLGKAFGGFVIGTGGRPQIEVSTWPSYLDKNTVDYLTKISRAPRPGDSVYVRAWIRGKLQLPVLANYRLVSNVAGDVVSQLDCPPSSATSSSEIWVDCVLPSDPNILRNGPFKIVASWDDGSGGQNIETSTFYIIPEPTAGTTSTIVYSSPKNSVVRDLPVHLSWTIANPPPQMFPFQSKWRTTLWERWPADSLYGSAVPTFYNTASQSVVDIGSVANAKRFITCIGPISTDHPAYVPNGGDTQIHCSIDWQFYNDDYDAYERDPIQGTSLTNVKYAIFSDVSSDLNNLIVQPVQFTDVTVQFTPMIESAVLLKTDHQAMMQWIQKAYEIVKKFVNGQTVTDEEFAYVNTGPPNPKSTFALTDEIVVMWETEFPAPSDYPSTHHVELWLVNLEDTKRYYACNASNSVYNPIENPFEEGEMMDFFTCETTVSQCLPPGVYSIEAAWEGYDSNGAVVTLREDYTHAYEIKSNGVTADAALCKDYLAGKPMDEPGDGNTSAAGRIRADFFAATLLTAVGTLFCTMF